MTTLSLATVLAEPARRWPDKVALVEGEQRLTYAEVWDRALRAAADLTAKGVGPGTRVALLAPNTVDFVVGYYGILAAGGTVVPVPSLLQGQEAAFLVQHSGAEAVLHHPALAPIAEHASELTGRPTWSTTGLGEGVEPLPHPVGRAPEDVAVIFYTSGTTGHPKGALLTHLNMVMNAVVNAFDFGDLSRDDVVMGALPLFHVYGQSVSMNTTFRAGGTLVLQPRFEPVSALELMVREGCTIFAGVPTMFVFLLQAAEHASALPRLRYCNSGGASLPVSVLDAFQGRFDTMVWEGYGLSETSPVATTNQPAFGQRPGSVGHAVWGVEVEIADDTVDDRIVLLPQGSRGEIVIRGHNVFAGYLDDPEATRAAIVDGWFRTGDIGTKDEDGYLFIVDRKKDLIIRGGFNVYPREVEEVLMTHPQVNQVAVIGLSDPTRGEEVVAVVVPVEGERVEPEDLLAFGRERLAHHKYPRRVELVDELPLGPSMKVLKRELRARFTPKEST
ncbi:long-chain-fatty-acid--CoA ligase [Arsenicicoccus piscis]|uniref:AMP-dependent synthetase n=1 Tax=Arsenicicoccus piscis TaxID=673954 RepID=A0ABQ6HU35_9MICO|nr:long-chain fatty acid--CoA ligase [Arsenicicoccus piscis]GMA21830.1 AMP-dependent synthetase [Arsenicicoccus piscis]